MTAEQGLWYFAHQYSVKTPDGKYSLAGEEANFRLCCFRAARLIEAGWNIYSPIAHTHPIHCAYPDFVGKEVHEMWYRLDDAFIKHANFTGIILPPEWRGSWGCKHEKELFKQMGREIRYLVEPCTVVKDDVNVAG